MTRGSVRVRRPQPEVRPNPLATGGRCALPPCVPGEDYIDYAYQRTAERIAAGQKPEIEAMKGWLKSYGKPLKAERHEHATMPGMATQAQLKKLRAADGKAFDRLFLTLMTTHHQGAITMATDVKGQGNNIRVEEMADEVIAQQTSEITRMRNML